MSAKSDSDQKYKIGQQILELQWKIVELQNQLNSIKDELARKKIADQIAALKKQIVDLVFKRNAIGAEPGSNAANGGKKPDSSGNKKNKRRFAVHVDKWSNRPASSKGLGSPTNPLPDTDTGKKGLKPGTVLVGINGAGAGRRPMIAWKRFPFLAPKVNKGGKPGIVPVAGAAAGGVGRVSGRGIVPLKR